MIVMVIKPSYEQSLNISFGVTGILATISFRFRLVFVTQNVFLSMQACFHKELYNSKDEDSYNFPFKLNVYCENKTIIQINLYSEQVRNLC